jgi:hypothetical protein
MLKSAKVQIKLQKDGAFIAAFLELKLCFIEKHMCKVIKYGGYLRG